jgi:hypothetical protein
MLPMGAIIKFYEGTEQNKNTQAVVEMENLWE